MNFLTRRQAHTLLQKATDTTLTTQEQQLLQSYLQTEEGQTYARLHQQLSDWHPEMDDEIFDHKQLRQATRKIDEEVQRRRRTRRSMRTGQTILGVTAVIALIIIGISWLQIRNQVSLEPTLSQPVVTVTPPAGMEPVDLHNVSPYYSGRTVTKAEEAAGYSLHLPTWQITDFVFKAADYYPETKSVELLSAEKISSSIWGSIWVLGQAKLTDESTKEPLPTFYNPYGTNTFKVDAISRQEITIDGQPAIYEQEYWFLSNNFYKYYVSRVSWEAEGKRFFLAILDEDEYVEPAKMLEIITNMRLETP
jgi:hypothetical protein